MKRKKKKNPLSYCLLSRRSLWYGTSSQAQLWVKHEGDMLLVFTQLRACRAREKEGMSVEPLVGSSSPRGASFPPTAFAELCNSHRIVLTREQGWGFSPWPPSHEVRAELPPCSQCEGARGCWRCCLGGGAQPLSTAGRDRGCCHLACGSGLVSHGIEMHWKPGGQDDKVTSMSLERETADELPDSLEKGLVEEFGCCPRTACCCHETGEGEISCVAVEQGQQQCKQLYLPGVKC